ncbi:hypothetical protein N9R79_03000 [Vibrio sp.]|nr:hypothetical protein [Vibrio sp.]
MPSSSIPARPTTPSFTSLFMLVEDITHSMVLSKSAGRLLFKNATKFDDSFELIQFLNEHTESDIPNDLKSILSFDLFIYSVSQLLRREVAHWMMRHNIRPLFFSGDTVLTSEGYGEIITTSKEYAGCYEVNVHFESGSERLYIPYEVIHELNDSFVDQSVNS